MEIIGTSRINKIVEEIVDSEVNSGNEHSEKIYINFGLNLISKKGLKVFLKSVFFRKKLIVHWIGSDIYYISAGGKKITFKRKLLQVVNKFFHITNWAAAPHVKDELEAIGIKSEVVYLPTRLIKEVEIKPLPKEFSLVTYLPNERHEFYGSKIIFEFAKRNPHMKLQIVANNGENMPLLNNVIYHGWVSEEEMNQIYEDSNGVIRIPIHDAMAGTVLEGVLRGRYAIWTYQSPYTIQANNLIELEAAVEKILNLKSPNFSGAEFIQENYSYKKLREEFLFHLSNIKK
ncbi:hypothetical protein ACTL32_01070 [Planococcus sp. FY231025]|uniref:hypothetical protein n=1 Tax=Planococcus sp. FY231025 TaxID=3455699 RepID=UPI003F923626